MKNSSVSIDVDSLLLVKEGIKRYIEMLNNNYLAVVDKSKLLGGWNDDDYEAYLSSIQSYGDDITNINKISDDILRKIDKKIEAIRALHSIEI